MLPFETACLQYIPPTLSVWPEFFFFFGVIKKKINPSRTRWSATLLEQNLFERLLCIYMPQYCRRSFATLNISFAALALRNPSLKAFSPFFFFFNNVDLANNNIIQLV